MGVVVGGGSSLFHMFTNIYFVLILTLHGNIQEVHMTVTNSWTALLISDVPVPDSDMEHGMRILKKNTISEMRVKYKTGRMFGKEQKKFCTSLRPVNNHSQLNREQSLLA